MHIDELKDYEIFKNSSIKTLKPLEQQGHSNDIYLLKTQEEKYLIRKFKISLDRQLEFKIQHKAFKKGIGAEPIFLDQEKGLMITHYLEGKHKIKLSQQELKKLALLLKKLHKIKTRQKKNSFKEHFNFKDKKVKKAFVFLSKEKKEYALGHNDLHARNILFYKKNIKLIDWEYARYSDVYFDLVSIIIEYKLKQKDKETFLQSYFGRRRVNHLKLKAFSLIYKELWKLWFEKLAKGEL